MMEEEDFIDSLIPAVEEQLTSKETLYVKATYERLLKDGIEESEVKRMMALCLAVESNAMFVKQRAFDAEHYKELLKGLPELPE